MKKLILIVITFALYGCGSYECIDAKFARQVKPIAKEFHVQLQFNEKHMKMLVRCEEYYDAMCNERGNYWTVREVGYKSQDQTSVFQFNDRQLGEVVVPIPPCTDMAHGKKTLLKNVVLNVNNEPYWLVSSQGDSRTYKSSKSFSGSEKTFKANIRLEVNGELVE